MTQATDIQLINVLLENKFLNMEKLIQNIYTATGDSYINFEQTSNNPAAHDSKFQRDLLYVPVARDIDIPIDNEILMQEMIALRVSIRHTCFCLFANSLEAEDETEALALSLVMDFRDIIDNYVQDTFSMSFIDVGQDRAFYGIKTLDLFKLFITNPSDWEALQMEELYEKAASTIAE